MPPDVPAPPAATVKVGSTDTAAIIAIQRRLNQLGCGPLSENGVFDTATETAVRQYQARFTDRDGLPLKVDGEVGPLTWHALFDVAPTPSQPVTDALIAAALKTATSQIGVLEQPLGSNRGPEVDTYLRSVGLDPAAGSFPWCAAFVYWCFGEASRSLGRDNPVIRTAGVMDHWQKAGVRGIRRIDASDAATTPGLVRGGQIFVIGTGGGTGHMGFVEQAVGGKLVTVEGNTNDGGSREGIGVFRRDKRKIADINVGFLDYAS